jgi:tetratricopeptide (TPR) repeat protein
MAKETVESFCQRAEQAITQGKNEEAQLYYKQALGLRPDNPDAHFGMATVYFLMGELPLAAYHFKEVTRLDPTRAGAFINLGAVYNRLEQFDNAIPVLRRGIQLDMNRCEGYYNLGLVYRRKGQPDLAIQAYREATRVNPRMADAHLNIANIFLEKLQFGLAIAHYRQALEIRPNWEKALRGLEQAETSQEELQNQGSSKTPSLEAGPKSPPKAAAATPIVASALNPERQVDPQIHGELLRTLHRVTVDSENQGRNFLKALESEVEPAIKELSSSLLYPDTSATELNECVRKFETAVRSLQTIQEVLQTSMERVRLMGEQLIRT